MVKFELDPGDVLEHSHEQDTTTVLLSGAADLILNGERRALRSGEVVKVPRNTSHTMVNTGTTPAVIGCVC